MTVKLTEKEEEMLREILDNQIQVTGYERAKTLIGLREKLLGPHETTQGEHDAEKDAGLQG